MRPGDSRLETPQVGELTIPHWLRRLLVAVTPIIPKEFVGTIEISIFRGGRPKIRLVQTFSDQE